MMKEGEIANECEQRVLQKEWHGAFLHTIRPFKVLIMFGSSAQDARRS